MVPAKKRKGVQFADTILVKIAIYIYTQHLYFYNLSEQSKRMASTTFPLEMLPDVVLEQVLSFISYDQENVATVHK